MQTRYSIQPKRNRAPFKTANGTDTDHDSPVQIHEREIRTPFNCSIVRFSSTRFRFLWGSLWRMHLFLQSSFSSSLPFFSSHSFGTEDDLGQRKGIHWRCGFGMAPPLAHGLERETHPGCGLDPALPIEVFGFSLSFHFSSVCAIALFFACHCGVVGWLTVLTFFFFLFVFFEYIGSFLLYRSIVHPSPLCTIPLLMLLYGWMRWV